VLLSTRRLASKCGQQPGGKLFTWTSTATQPGVWTQWSRQSLIDVGPWCADAPTDDWSTKICHCGPSLQLLVVKPADSVSKQCTCQDTEFSLDYIRYAQGDSDVISMPAGYRRHLVGETLINVFHCDITEIRFVGKLMIIRTFS